MKKMTIYKCDFCEEIESDSTNMWIHERMCLKNPKTKSCQTCLFLSKRNFLKDGRKLSKKENNILETDIKGTYYYYEEKGADGIVYKRTALNKEYRYLLNSEQKPYCNFKHELLRKMKTKCEHWKAK